MCTADACKKYGHAHMLALSSAPKPLSETHRERKKAYPSKPQQAHTALIQSAVTTVTE